MVVKFFAHIRKLAGNTKERTDVKAESLYELLDKLSRDYGNEFQSKVFPNNTISNEVIILVNGTHISHLNGLNTKLKEGDIVCIFPMIFGG